MPAALSVERRPLPSGLGIEISGVDLNRPIPDSVQDEIRAAWIDAGLLLFRAPGITDEGHMRLSQVFGELEQAATARLNNPDNPYLMTLSYDPDNAKARSGRQYVVDGVARAGWLGWHWDQSFMPTIVRGAVLRMVEPAAEMGETGFIDAVAAYDRLPPEMKARIHGLEVVYEFNPDFTSGQFGFPQDISMLASGGDGSSLNYDFPPCVHPLVITQVETGRKVLKLSPMHARYILGMHRVESDALLQDLAVHLCDDRFAYYHKWQRDDLVVWDNWRMIHSAKGVPLHCRRRATRTTIMGDYKVGRYLDSALDRDRTVQRIVD